MTKSSSSSHVLMYVDSDRYYYPAQLDEGAADITGPVPTWTYEHLHHVKSIHPRMKHPPITSFSR